VIRAVILENCRGSKKRKFQSLNPYDLVAKIDVPTLVDSQNSKTGKGVKLVSKESGTIEGLKEAAGLSLGNKVSLTYVKPSLIPNVEKKIEVTAHIVQKCKTEDKKYLGDLNLNLLRKPKNPAHQANIKWLDTKNLLPSDQSTYRNSRGAVASTDFIDKDLANTFLLNWKESLGYDHPVITAYQIDVKGYEKRVCRKKLIECFYLNNLVLNEALDLSYKYAIGKKKVINSKSFIEELNQDRITANTRIKRTSKLVYTIYDEDTKKILTKTQEIKEKIQYDYIFKLYGGIQRESLIEIPFEDLEDIDVKEMTSILKQVNVAKATGPDGIPQKMARTILDTDDPEIILKCNRLWKANYLNKRNPIDLCSKLVPLNKPNTMKVLDDISVVKWRPIAVPNFHIKLCELRFKPVLD